MGKKGWVENAKVEKDLELGVFLGGRDFLLRFSLPMLLRCCLLEENLPKKLTSETAVGSDTGRIPGRICP